MRRIMRRINKLKTDRMKIRHGWNFELLGQEMTKKCREDVEKTTAQVVLASKVLAYTPPLSHPNSPTMIASPGLPAPSYS